MNYQTFLEAISSFTHTTETDDRPVTEILHDQIVKHQKAGFQKIGTTAAFSRAYSHPDDDSSITKIGFSASREPSEDPYVRFIKTAQEKSASHGNPHLPRAESIHSIVGSDGTIHITKMEKLHHIDKLTGEEVEAAQQHLSQGTSYFNNPSRFFNPSDSIPHSSKHPKLDQVRGLIKKTHGDIEHRDPYYDIHSKNYMVRRTPTGPQLVVTDPIATGEDLFSDNRRKIRDVWGDV